MVIPLTDCPFAVTMPTPGATWARKCMVCNGPGRVPWHGFQTVHDPVPPRLLEVSGCRCRPVCAACFALVGGFLERAPCLLCGLSCGQAGCSPLVVPGQPFAEGEPFGCPQLQWLRSLSSLSCGAAVHHYANVAPGVVPGFGPWPSRPPLESSSASSASSVSSEASSEASDEESEESFGGFSASSSPAPASPA